MMNAENKNISLFNIIWKMHAFRANIQKSVSIQWSRVLLNVFWTKDFDKPNDFDIKWFVFYYILHVLHFTAKLN